MASSKYQSIKQQAECWTASKLSVKVQSSFKCESPVNNSEGAHKLIRAAWDKGKLNEQEQMMAFFVSFDNQIVSYHAAFMRTVDRTYGNPRYILILALHTLACSIILAHNHPSGILVPSAADITLTKQIKCALDLIEVKLVDHLIINEKTYLSMSDEGFI
jgi:DNA repair protein RadC